MNEGEIYEGIRQILNETFKLRLQDIKEDSRLDEDLGLDSVDFMDAVGLFEEKFGIVLIDEKEKEPFRVETVKDIVQLTIKKQSRQR